MTTNSSQESILTKLRLLSTLEQTTFTDGQIVTQLTLDQNTCELIANISEIAPSCDISVQLADSQSTIRISDISEHEGENVTVQAYAPRTNSYFFARDITDLVNSGYSYDPPQNYYIYALDKLNTDEIQGEELSKYIQIMKFAHQLQSTKSFDHREISTEGQVSLLFLNPKKRFDLSLMYDFNSIEIDAESIKKHTLSISNMFSDSLHFEDKKILFKATLTDFLYLRSEHQKLEYLINHLSEFCKKFGDNYELFISEFSFENEIERVHQERREFTSRLNDLLSGIQTKLLAVPLSFLVSGSQMKPVDTLSTSISNFFIVISVFVFVLIIIILISTQLSLLEAVKNEFSAKKLWLQHNLPNNSEELSTEFSALEFMSSNIEKNLKIIGLSAALSLVFSVILWSYYLFP